jgi:hypothetical protein
MMVRLSLICAFALNWAVATGPAAGQEGGNYASDLATLYNERHRLVALKEACSRVLPEARRDTQAAYEEWADRHELVLENLEARFLLLIRRASRDQQEYARNYGKYHGAVLREREAQKEAFLALPRDALIKECRELPGYLRSAKSDMYNRHPAEFNAIYGKKKP